VAKIGFPQRIPLRFPPPPAEHLACEATVDAGAGDHPETAMDRMRWVRQLVGGLTAYSTQRAA
jgi:hypothetical protein